MTLAPAARKAVVTAHVVASVGWLGAVAAFLALAIAGLRSGQPETVRAAYLSMDLTADYVIVPLSIAALATGLLVSLGTTWGLFRHYWVLIKLLITLLSTLLLVLHLQPIGHLGSVVAETTLAAGELQGMRVQLVASAAAALGALLVATVLSVYKPRGLTPYGWRKEREERATGIDQAS